jgi:hypothetical protein
VDKIREKKQIPGGRETFSAHIRKSLRQYRVAVAKNKTQCPVQTSVSFNRSLLTALGGKQVGLKTGKHALLLAPYEILSRSPHKKNVPTP